MLEVELLLSGEVANEQSGIAGTKVGVIRKQQVVHGRGREKLRRAGRG